MDGMIFNDEQRKEFDAYLNVRVKLLLPDEYKKVRTDPAYSKAFIQECALEFLDILRKREERLKDDVRLWLKDLFAELYYYVEGGDECLSQKLNPVKWLSH